MGRYFEGDIEGKFWFGVQSSSAADRFGREGVTPSVLEYYFEEIQPVFDELIKILKNMGRYKPLLDKFFREKDGYNEEMLIDYFATKYINLNNKEIKNLLSEYADFELGKKIYKCLKKQEYCEFTAEL